MSSSTNIAGMGGVIRDSQGRWIVGFIDNLENATAIQEEFRALYLGLELALKRNLVPLEVSIDAVRVLHLLHSDNMHYANLITDCRYLLGLLRNAIVEHTYREGNEVADGLAKAGFTISITATPLFFEEPPDFVETFLHNDQTGVPRIRKKHCLLQHMTDEDQAFANQNIHTMCMDASTSPFVLDTHTRAHVSTTSSCVTNNSEMDAFASTSL
ncbi:putative ribonuclease h protein [Nicotiana attenuata]|uniref:Ribonuclease h protein n=1 Tax=Nicotiana attenuata TaxID=49451 RepID=A0A314KYF6_NICAT|nr:putative ribonuclease h protein [Nicotiana attenuata]